MSKLKTNIGELAASRNIEGLTGALKSKNNSLRYAAANALSKLGPDAAGAIPALIDALKHWDSMTRSAAAGAIGKIGISHKDIVEAAIPALTEALDDNDTLVRRAAATALQDIDPEPWYAEVEEDPEIHLDSL
ncbi:MAG: HEAT repeat domain-containing protein [Chloroflexota bacterium]|nr:HEAT repeat domain-containing protein [Chloroflexota bacterium]